MQEQWSKWEPLLGLGGRYDVDAVVNTYDERGLIIILSSYKDSNQKIEVTFNKGVDSYRHTDESFIIELPNNLSKQYADSFYVDWNFFKISHSKYAAWAAQMSEEDLEKSHITHFCFYCPDSVLDVIACYEPEVKRTSP